MNPIKKWRELRRAVRRADPKGAAAAQAALDAHERTLTPKQLAQVRAEEQPC